MRAAPDNAEQDGRPQLRGMGRYEWVELIVSSDLTATQKLVAHTLAFHADYVSGRKIRPSYKTLMAETSLGLTALKRTLGQLLNLDLIDRVSRGSSRGRNGGCLTPVYRLTDPGAAFLAHINEGHEVADIHLNQGHEVTTITENQGHDETNEGHDVTNEGHDVTKSGSRGGPPPLHETSSRNLQGKPTLVSPTHAHATTAAEQKDLPPSDDELDYQQAAALLQALPDLGQGLITKARTNDPALSLQQAVIRAARTLRQGRAA